MMRHSTAAATSPRPFFPRPSQPQALAEELYHEPAALLHLHGGEYGSRTSVARLVGAAPGYIGYGSGGLLTDALRRRPHCVLLVEQADRAHPEVGGRAEGGWRLRLLAVVHLYKTKAVTLYKGTWSWRRG